MLLRPDAGIAAVQTARSFIVTYTLTLDPSARIYQQIRIDTRAARRLSGLASASASSGATGVAQAFEEEAARGVRELHARFRMVVQIDAGVARARALDDELLVATARPAAVQCIRWAAPDPGAQTVTQLLSRLPWMPRGSAVVEVAVDRAMGMHIWVAVDGRAYAVQRRAEEAEGEEGEEGEAAQGQGQGQHFRGHGFHVPDGDETRAQTAAINARFSLLAVGCASGQVYVYTARDYAGSVPLSHKLEPPASLATTGAITALAFSPDGYGLFVGYARGWVLWSVFGQMGGSSFAADTALARAHGERWLLGVQDAVWIAGGAEIVFTTPGDRRIGVLELARSAVTGCFGPANLARMLLVTDAELFAYRGHDVPDMLSLSTEGQWDRVPMPAAFLVNQRPIRCAVTSPDGRYLAIAGRRGLAHYSIQSGRWKTFDDVDAENEFVVRGGMLWYQHVLIASVDTGDHDEVTRSSHQHYRPCCITQSRPPAAANHAPRSDCTRARRPCTRRRPWAPSACPRPSWRSRPAATTRCSSTRTTTCCTTTCCASRAAPSGWRASARSGCTASCARRRACVPSPGTFPTTN